MRFGKWVWLFAVVAGGCTRYGMLGAGNTEQLVNDAKSCASDDPARLGRYAVLAEGEDLQMDGTQFPVVTYRPVGFSGRAPAVVFLPGRFSPEDEYEGYGRLLASRGYIVAVRARYGWYHPDKSLVKEARLIAKWLVNELGADPARIGVAGHSMGGCDSIAAAAQDPMFRAVVAIEPGGPDSPNVIGHVVQTLRVPLLIIGAEVATQGNPICGRKQTNYLRYFEHAPDGTVELELRGADHMQVMDDPDRLGMGMCRVGTADSREVRTLSRRATVSFFDEHLRGAKHLSLDTGGISRVRVKSPGPAVAAGSL
jgi:dienelactone hydrolase